jgi:CheY-like chemotaxis protein
MAGDPHLPTLEMLSRLAGGLAHDLNNLFTVIGGRCALALDRIGAGQPGRHDIEVIRDTVERAVALASQLRAFGGRQRLDPRVLDVNTFVSDKSDALRRILGERIELVVQLAAAPGQVEVDPDLLEEALLHLASVACDAMPDGGRLTVSTTRIDPGSPRAGGGLGRDALVIVRIGDTGPDLDADVLPRIFEPFVALPGRRKSPGLRLAAAQAIVDQSGGRIEVESRAGGGTTFAIHLPAAATAPLPREAGTRPRAAGAGCVIVVDDEPDVRGFAAQVLRDAGYRVLEAEGGARALQVIHGCEEPVRLVIIDMAMPGMGGPELARRLAATHPGTRVLFTSGFASGGPQVPGSLADLETDFLAKPFGVDALTGKVRSLLA